VQRAKSIDGLVLADTIVTHYLYPKGYRTMTNPEIALELTKTISSDKIHSFETAERAKEIADMYILILKKIEEA